MNVGFLASQADGLGVGNEMNLVAALRQFQTQFRGHNAAAAVRGITGDPDLHSARPPFPVLYSMAGNNSGCRFYRAARFGACKKSLCGEPTLRFSVPAWRVPDPACPGGLESVS